MYASNRKTSKKDRTETKAKTTATQNCFSNTKKKQLKKTITESTQDGRQPSQAKPSQAKPGYCMPLLHHENNRLRISIPLT